MASRFLGLDGEAVARDYLTGTGAEIIAANVRIGGGEIDIIALDNGVYAFIEVKRRSDKLHGRPAEAVTPGKMRKIISAAAAYMAENGLSDAAVRFDIIELLPGEINHIRGAFDATGLY